VPDTLKCFLFAQDFASVRHAECSLGGARWWRTPLYLQDAVSCVGAIDLVRFPVRTCVDAIVTDARKLSTFRDFGRLQSRPDTASQIGCRNPPVDAQHSPSS